MAIKVNLQLSGEIELPDPLNVAIQNLPPIQIPPEVFEKIIVVLAELANRWPVPAPLPTPAPTPLPVPPPPFVPVSSLTSPAYGQPSTDSRIVYVSSSTGNDTSDGLSEAGAKKTIAAGYALLRTDMPDRLLLKKGDTWVETLGTWKKCGRSPQEPMVIGAYGTGPRPILKTGGNSGIIAQNSGGTPLVMHSITISGLHFYAHTRDPDGPEFTSSQSSPNGIRWLRGGHHITIDDCYFDSYHTTIVIQDYENTGMQDMTVRGCVVVDSYSDNQGHSQGIYCQGVDRLLVEDCILDHNGWNTTFPGATATIFNHNMYLQYTCKNVTTRRNILMRASSHAIQQRSGGMMEDTFAWRNPIGLTMGSKDNPAPNLGTVTGTIKNSVVLEGTDITPVLPRGWGIHFEPIDIKAITISDNVIANVAVTGVNRLSIMDQPTGTYTNNTVWNWPSVWGTNSTRFDSPGPFKSPSRSLVGYLGLTEPQIIAKLRQQSRDTYDPALTAQSINAYIRAGFVPA